MKTILSLAAPAEVETECLAVVVLDRSQKDHNEKDRGAKAKPEVTVDSSDTAIGAAAADVMASGEVSAKLFEATLLHRPAKLKAKRLLLLGGGKAKDFSSSELRKLAGAAVRFLIDGASLAGDAAAYERIVLLFDGDDPDALEAARARWSEAKAAGAEVTYWQADEKGRWRRQG